MLKKRNIISNNFILFSNNIILINQNDSLLPRHYSVVLGDFLYFFFIFHNSLTPTTFRGENVSFFIFFDGCYFGDSKIITCCFVIWSRFRFLLVLLDASRFSEAFNVLYISVEKKIKTEPLCEREKKNNSVLKVTDVH